MELKKKGNKVPALEKQPKISLDTQRILSIVGELDNFSGNLLFYCEYYGINDIDEREFLSDCVLEAKNIVKKDAEE